MESPLYYVITRGIRNFQICRYLGLAGYVIYVYDFLITYSEVQRLIWPSPMSVVKACYYINHIVAPIGLTITTWQMSGLTRPLSDTFCTVWVITAGYMEIISLGLSTMILLLKLYTLYGRSKKVLFGLLALFVASYITITVTTTLSILAIKDHIYYSLVVKACVIDNKPPFLASIWAGPIVCEILVTCMMVYKGIEHAREANSIANSPILYTLYRDGVGYFIVIMVLKLFNLLVWWLGDKTIILIGIYFTWGVVTALVSRILLNLRSTRNPCGQDVSLRLQQLNSRTEPLPWRQRADQVSRK